MRADKVAVLIGAYGLAMVLGAVFMQFVVGIAPCEMCFWQRYPHIGAAVIGLGGVLVSYALPGLKKWLPAFAVLAILLVATSGLIGVYHSGVEWKLLPGPSACTGDRFIFTGRIDLNAPAVVRCDIVSWRLFGIFSLANLNALISLTTAVAGFVLLCSPALAEKLLVRFKTR